MLSPLPKTLGQLWREYLVGTPGRPAKDFTPSERGHVKTIYCQRNHFWRAMTKLTRLGYSDVDAIQLVERAYPASTMTRILSLIRQDKQHQVLEDLVNQGRQGTARLTL